MPSLFSSDIGSKKEIDIGIISFRPIAENQQIWQPLVDEVHQINPNFKIKITSGSLSDIDNLIAHNKLDFVVVHPGAFVELEHKYGITNIASLVRESTFNGKNIQLTRYGGVIITLSSRHDIKTLKDVRGKSIATTHKKGTASMLMQQEEFANEGIDIVRECKMIYTGQSSDEPIQLLKSGKADVAFMRTGYIEEMVEKGRLNLNELSILSPRSDPNFPFLHSTKLYPEWAVAATTRPTNTTVKEFTIALYKIHDNVSKDFHSFSIPLPYRSIRALMQKYHVYPFDQQLFSLEDVIQEYAYTLIILLSMIIIAGTSFTIYYIVSSRKNNQHTKEMELILSTASDGVHVHDLEGKLHLFSDSFASMLGYTRQEAEKLTIYDWDHHIDPNTIQNDMKNITHELMSFETQHTKKDGTNFDVEINARAILLNNKRYIYSSSRDITERKMNQSKLEEAKEHLNKLAHHDPLTGLPNRLSLIELLKIKTHNMEDHPFALFFLDLDGFKEVNDSYGHRFGDTLLIHFSSLLQDIFPPNTFIVRTGGDEFVIVLGCQKDHNLINTAMEKLVSYLNNPFHIEATDIYITASVGIAMYPKDALSAEELLQCADAAMYNAKKMGKNTYSFYTSSFTESSLYRTTIATNLKKAISSKELELFYQPQVDALTSEIIGCEALLRWLTPDGYLSPALFIPIAEESGLIHELGEMVLRQGFSLAYQWYQENLLRGRIAINISPRQLAHVNFLTTLERIIVETNCNPHWIELEITESSILENPTKMITLLSLIKAKGFHISIDDFGTGYSSLSYLKNLPIDKLKIDQSFVRNVTHEPKNQTIVQTIIALAKGLRMSVIAEGVETEDELAFLRENGVDMIQGYYFYKPMNHKVMEELLRGES